MRAFVAASLAAYLALAALVPHVHHDDAGAGASHPCAVCQSRTAAEVTARTTPDLAPSPVPVGAVLLAPGLPPVTGAPLGAIPGQSPPVSA